MEKGERKSCPDEISANTLQEQLLGEGLNALPEGEGKARLLQSPGQPCST